MEVWGGIECSVNRVHNDFFDQLDYAGHYHRAGDINAFNRLGFKKIRYPVLWEKHQPQQDKAVDWSATETRLCEMRDNGVDVIAGLVHHGSGPAYVNIIDNTFEDGLAAYAKNVAEKFPWIEYYTPVNEPLTTARFCGLYGLWYPHHNDNKSFCRILINECKATILAMLEIRKINPQAKLVQTDDLAKIHSTELLKYQADFENDRRWLSYDLLCGRVNEQHPLYDYLLVSGIDKLELQFFIANKCVPDVMGFNHYLTSERYLDENLEQYPPHTHGGNGRHRYADVEAVRVGSVCPDGPYSLLKAAWERYQLPMAVTEVHLSCTREEQMRWLSMLWNDANRLKEEGIDIRAITAWALLGSFGWNNLLTRPNGHYEPGVFDLSGEGLRPTAVAHMITAYNSVRQFKHPVINNNGWWQRKCRVIYGNEHFFKADKQRSGAQPVLITGKTGTLGNAFARICDIRGITYKIFDRDGLDITNPGEIEKIILAINPWAIINTAGFVRVDDAETQAGNCFAVNTNGPENLAVLCAKYDIKLLTYSTDLVFNGSKTNPYTEKDNIAPLNIYGQSKAQAEQKVLSQCPNALVIRSSAFFGPWDNYNFLKVIVENLRYGRSFKVANDVMVSPTYLPDLVNTSLDLLLDDEKGIWHLTNKGQIIWSQLACSIVDRLQLSTHLIEPVPLSTLGYKAQRPVYSVLSSERGSILPALDNAIDRCMAAINAA